MIVYNSTVALSFGAPSRELFHVSLSLILLSLPPAFLEFKTLVVGIFALDSNRYFVKSRSSGCGNLGSECLYVICC